MTILTATAKGSRSKHRVQEPPEPDLVRSLVGSASGEGLGSNEDSEMKPPLPGPSRNPPLLVILCERFPGSFGGSFGTFAQRSQF